MNNFVDYSYTTNTNNMCVIRENPKPIEATVYGIWNTIEIEDGIYELIKDLTDPNSQMILFEISLKCIKIHSEENFTERQSYEFLYNRETKELFEKDRNYFHDGKRVYNRQIITKFAPYYEFHTSAIQMLDSVVDKYLENKN